MIHTPFARARSIPLLALALLTAATMACATLSPAPHPEIVWNPAADAEVLAYTCGGGMEPMNAYANAIAPLTIWGDGRAIWTTSNPAGGRRVMVTQFTNEGLRAILEHVSAAGFFGWRDLYEPDQPVMDAGSCSLSVSLTGADKRVTVADFAESPPNMDELVSWLLQTAGETGTDFVPTRGYLQTWLLLDATGPADRVWPADGIDGVRLGDAQGGLLVEGEALRAAWDIVNADTYMIVECDGGYYQLTVQVEGVTERWDAAP